MCRSLASCFYLESFYSLSLIYTDEQFSWRYFFNKITLNDLNSCLHCIDSKKINLRLLAQFFIIHSNTFGISSFKNWFHFSIETISNPNDSYENFVDWGAAFLKVKFCEYMYRNTVMLHSNYLIHVYSHLFISSLSFWR